MGKDGRKGVKKKVISYDLSKWKLVPELEQKAKTFLNACYEAGYELRITQGYRSVAYQNQLYAQGRTKPGAIVTYAKGGESKHNFGRAFDYCFMGKIAYPKDNGQYKKIADIGMKCGLVAGYYFSKIDRLHFELPK